MTKARPSSTVTLPSGAANREQRHPRPSPPGTSSAACGGSPPPSRASRWEEQSLKRCRCDPAMGTLVSPPCHAPSIPALSVDSSVGTSGQDGRGGATRPVHTRAGGAAHEKGVAVCDPLSQEPARSGLKRAYPRPIRVCRDPGAVAAGPGIYPRWRRQHTPPDRRLAGPSTEMSRKLEQTAAQLICAQSFVRVR